MNRTALLAFAASAVLGLAVFQPTDADARPGARGHHGHGHHGHRHHGHRHGHWHWGHRHWRPRHIVVYRPYATYRPVAPVHSACTCLRKTYLPNGAVMFQDVCTNESAINAPAQAS